MRVSALLAAVVALLCVVVSAEVQLATADYEDNSAGASVPTKRKSNAQLKQLSFLLEENKRLKSEIGDLQRTLEDEEKIAARRAIEEAEAKTAQDLREKAEQEAVKASKEAEAAKLALQLAEQQRIIAKANESASAAALEAAQLSLQESKIRAQTAEIEKAKADAEAAKAQEIRKQLEAQRAVAEATAAQWSAIQSSAEANATALQAAADTAAAAARQADAERRSAELAARAAEDQRVAADIQARIHNSEVGMQQAELAKAEAEVKAAGAESERWKAEYEGLKASHDAALARFEHEQTRAAAVDLSEAVGAAKEAVEQSLELVQSARVDGEKASASAVRQLELRLEIARAEAEAAERRAIAASDEYRKAEATKVAALAAAEQQRSALSKAQLDAATAEAESQSARLNAEAAADRLRTAEAEAALQQAAADAASAREREASARASEAQAKAKRAEDDRLRAQASALESVSLAEAAKANATAEVARANAASAELEAARLHKAAAESEASAAREQSRLVDARASEAKASLKVWEERRKLAEAEATSAAAQVSIAAETTAQLELQASIAAHNTSRAVQYRLAKESEAYAASMAVQVESERAAVEQAKADVLLAEKYKLEAESAVLKAKADYEFARAHAESSIERSRADRDVIALNKQDELARKRDADRIEQEAEIARLREGARLSAEMQILEARKEFDKDVADAKARIDMEGRIREARENEDVHVRAAAAAAEAERAKILAAVTTALTGIGEGFKALVTVYLQETVTGIALVAASIYAAREGFTFARLEVQRILGQPVLVRETSRKSGLFAWIQGVVDALTCGALSSFVSLLTVAWSALRPARKAVVSGAEPSAADPFADVIMAPDLEIHVRTLAHATRNAHVNHAPLRHAMFYGPPGTGKTMVAHRLARHCGLEYAIMSGGDVAPLGSAAVSELNKLFDWAKSTPKGLLLFIDEAEAFLGSRSRTHMSENLRNVLSALLYHTGEQSTRFMLVLATNRPGDLDSAVADRVDEALFFGAPGNTERTRLARLYFYKHLASRSPFSQASTPIAPLPDKQTRSAANAAAASGSARVMCKRRGPPQILVDEGVTAELLDAIALEAVGFSGRQMAKLMMNIQAMVYAAGSVRLSTDAGATSSSSKPAAACVLTLAMVRTALRQEREKLDRRLANGPIDAQSSVAGGSASAGHRVPAVGMRSPSAADPASSFWAASASALSYSSGGASSDVSNAGGNPLIDGAHAPIDGDDAHAFVVPASISEPAAKSGRSRSSRPSGVAAGSKAAVSVASRRKNTKPPATPGTGEEADLFRGPGSVSDASSRS